MIGVKWEVIEVDRSIEIIITRSFRLSIRQWIGFANDQLKILDRTLSRLTIALDRLTHILTVGWVEE